MGHLQTDYFSIPASKLIPLSKSIVLKDAFSKLAFEKLINWDYVLDKSSIPAGIYAMWEKEIAAAMAQQFIPKEVSTLISFQITTIIQYLQNPEKYFGENAIQKRNTLLENSFETAIKKLKIKLGVDIAGWQYGQEKYKHITFQHPLSDLVSADLKSKLNIGPLPRGGNGSTPGSTGSADNQLSGASFRILIDTKDWDNAKMINTPGQSGDYKSPFYKNLFSLWANDQYFPAYYSKSLILKSSAEHVFLQPN